MNFRNHIFEFEDLDWFPDTIRESMTDYLRYMITSINFYQAITPIIIQGLHQTNSDHIIDLGSGGGGAIEQIQKQLQQQYNGEIKITLTDKYPNKQAFEFLWAKTKGSISFFNSAVDAADVPITMKGFRTMFSGFHHFNKPLAKTVLKNAVDAQSGIAIFDGGDKNLFAVILIMLIHPIVFFLFTPFFMPFRISRYFFTYLIPVIPFCTVWDGIVSIIRLYRPEELLIIAQEVDKENYFWEAGKVKSTFGMHVTYLIGYPLK